MTVYCVRRKNDHLVKIGYTANLRERLLTHGNQHPEGIELIVSAPGGRDLERVLHELLANECVAGEWFRPCPMLNAVIMALIATAEKSAPVDSSEPSQDIRTEIPEAPDMTNVSALAALFEAAPDFSTIPADEALQMQNLSWDERHAMAMALREWGADAAEWIMPELKMGRPK